MSRTIRAAATAMATAIVASSLLAAPLLAAKGGAGGGGGTTTTTTFSATAVATPAYSIVVGAITKVTFTYSWRNGATRTLRTLVPSSYVKPQTGVEFSSGTGEGAGFVVRTPDAATGGCTSSGLTTADNAILVTTADCSSGSFSFDYYAQTNATGAAKFAVYADGATLAATPFATLTLNAASAKVSITSITYTDGSTAASFAAGDVVRLALKVTDSKGRTTLIGVPLTVSDSNTSLWAGGVPACTTPTDWVVCTNASGTATADVVVTGDGQHQFRAAIGSYSGQRSVSVAAGPAAALVLTSDTEGDLALGEDRVLTVAATDAYDNALALGTADVAWGTGDSEGDVAFSGEAANLDGSVSITATGDVTGGVTLRAVVDELDESTAFTVVAGEIAALTISNDEGDLSAGSSRTLTVAAENAFGIGLAIVESDIDWTTATGDEALVSFAGETANGDGTVSIDVTGEAAGAATVIAAAGSVTDDTTLTIVDHSVASVSLSSDTEGDLSSNTNRILTVAAFDGDGNQVAIGLDDVDWTTGAGEEAFVSFGTESANGDGTVSIVITGELTGGVVVTATVTAGGAPAQTDTTSFTVVAGVLASLTIAGDGTDLATGTTRTLTVVGVDANGNQVDVTGLTLTASQSGGDGTVTVGTVSGGTFDVTGGTAGTIELSVSDGTVTSATPFTFSVTTGD